MKVGDVVYIRGDKRINNDGRCAYTPDQLVDGKYIKRHGSDKAWEGPVTKIDSADGRALVGGGWRPIDHYELVPDRITPFVQELAALLKKYDASLSVDIDGDTHGLITNFEVSIGGQTRIVGHHVSSIDASDLG